MATKDSGKVLVDTSVWIDYFRKKEPAYGVVSELLREERICCIGIVLAELLQGAKSMKEINVIKDFIHIFEFLPETPQLWEQTGELSFHLRSKGKTVGLSDCFIAVMSKQYNAALLSFDTDFAAINDEMKLNLYPVHGLGQ
ncbi:MAG: PIN domain-containing protein [Candidatus Latescibacterota bacterium]